ncbi:carboxymethylenebutenolidase [Bordetella genomosp. 1]|uniref:Carboxymethylenebutenolidase n=1 Tax=Bordetella genomosp. 1 TaxID=1395607 RepID=A0A261SUR2_9BORD|nr:dienelactone hydrolase family protein [Bordetella genomosp. 1]MDQ8031554.1 dienelactone hydrolase family protein [Bordetella sp.]OZI40732.1 carboxymethylenebutenolidase [Bordetella genomosp. 1]
MTSTVQTRTVRIEAQDGGAFDAYLAVPAAGKGPGLVLCQEIFGVNDFMRRTAQLLAEEGYVVIVPDLFWRQQPGIQLTDGPSDMPRAFALYQGFDENLGVADIGATVAKLRTLPECEGGVGALGYCLGGKLAYLAACRTDVDVAVGYYGVGIENSLAEADALRGKLVLHIAEQDGFCPPPARAQILEALGGRPGVELYVYPGMDHAFARTGGDHYDKPSALMAHQRSIAALKAAIGPHYDYSYLWDKHCEYEFGTRDVAATMATMVAEPYVNHIPTMTGGVGFKELSRFYQHHFVNSNPPDTRLIPLSRTVGATQIVDEMLFCFTHTTEIDWMLPGVAPTGKPVEVPLIAIVKFRGDKLYHEHIYWDQASVLVQIGLLDPQGLPVAGVETARKLLDETLPSNTLMARWKDSA